MPASWQYVLYGMEFKTDLEPMRSAYPRMDEAQREFAMIQQAAGHAAPTSRAPGADRSDAPGPGARRNRGIGNRLSDAKRRRRARSRSKR